MKIPRLIFGCVFAAAFAHFAGCGGKVVIDQGETGEGGASSSSGSTGKGSSGAGSSSSSSSTSGGGTINCGMQSCSQDSSGSCSCEGWCEGSKLDAQCSPSSGPGGESVCTCIMNDEPITKCIGENATCDIFAGCCAAFFFGQP